jgi:hypothetical protein
MCAIRANTVWDMPLGARAWGMHTLRKPGVASVAVEVGRPRIDANGLS